MHVALNALSINNRSGTGRYSWGLIQGLVQIAPKDFFLSVLIPSNFSIPVSWQDNNSVRFYSIPIRSIPHRIFWEQWQLPGLLNQLRPDLLHSPAFFAPVLRPGTFKQVVTIHDLAFLRYPQTIPWIRRWFYRWMIPKSWQKADAVITDSQSMVNDMSRLQNPPSQLFSIHLGCDSEKFNPVPTDHDPLVLNRYHVKQPYILFVGTREPRKNLAVVLQAFQKVIEQGLSYELVIVGRAGWMETREWKSIPGVKWLGYVPDDDLPVLYRNAYATVAPSIYEGFDLPALEAAACGSTVLASDIPVHREVLQAYPIYIPPRDTAKWAEAIRNVSIIENRDFLSIRSWKDMARETWDVYQAVIEKPGK